jgi:hypothetical protein
MQTIYDLSDRSFTTLLVEFSRLAARVQPFNVVVTNVPGPTFPVYILGARMLACYPLVPLFRDQGIGVALFSYAGRLHWGVNADWDVAPDVHDLVEAIAIEFEALRAAAGRVEPPAAAAAHGAANGATTAPPARANGSDDAHRRPQ